jgi:hypothetical protein
VSRTVAGEFLLEKSTGEAVKKVCKQYSGQSLKVDIRRFGNHLDVVLQILCIRGKKTTALCFDNRAFPFILFLFPEAMHSFEPVETVRPRPLCCFIAVNFTIKTISTCLANHSSEVWGVAPLRAG